MFLKTLDTRQPRTVIRGKWEPKKMNPGVTPALLLVEIFQAREQLVRLRET